MRPRVIAIDGPASSGKSTISRLVAERLGYRWLDTGAMYRAATLAAMRSNVDLSSASALEKSLVHLSIGFGEGLDAQKVYLNGQDVTEAIRDPEVTANVHHLASSAAVRAWMRRAQREFGAGQPTVAEGRDMGTVVFPDSPCKIYLDADPEVRAERRRRELAANGREVSYQEILDSIRQRDRRDRERQIAPLRKAPESVVVDTSGMTIDEAADACVRIAEDRGLA